eukprot:s3137_g1.t1
MCWPLLRLKQALAFHSQRSLRISLPVNRLRSPMAAYLEEPLYAFWKNPGAGEDSRHPAFGWRNWDLRGPISTPDTFTGFDDTAETPGMRMDIEKFRMRYRAYRLGYSHEKTYEEEFPVDKNEIVCEPIDAPLFNHLSDAKRAEIGKYRADYRKYRLGYASGARGEVADLFRRQLSEGETCEPVAQLLERTVSQGSGEIFDLGWVDDNLIPAYY